MTTKACVLSVLFLFLFNFCYAQSNKVGDSKGKLVVDLDKAKIYPDTAFLASSLFKSLKIVPLETNELCLIGRINKIMVFDQYIFVLDNTIANSLYMFDKEGRFIRKIGSVGQGPGEYIGISDFAIDRVNRTIYIIGSRLPRIHKYDLATGKFIQTIHLDRNDRSKRFMHFVSVGGKLYAEGLFVEHSDKNYLLYSVDESSGKEKDNFLNVMEYNKGISVLQSHTIFYPFILRGNGDALFFQSFMNHIIEITKDGVFSLIEFKGKNLLTPDESKRTYEFSNMNNRQNSSRIFEATDKYMRVVAYIEKGDHIIVDMMKGFQLHRFLINKKTKETSIFEKCYLDDLLYNDGRGFFPAFGCNDVNGAYYYVNDSRKTLTFQELAKAGSLSPDIIGLEKLAKLDSEDNPILFYYEFKE